MASNPSRANPSRATKSTSAAQKPPADDEPRVAGGGNAAEGVDPAESGASSHVEQPLTDDVTDPKPDKRPRATVQPVRYASGTGWKVGQAAPADRYRDLDPATGEPTGKAYASPKPGRYATQVAVKGDLVTQAMLDSVNAKE